MCYAFDIAFDLIWLLVNDIFYLHDLLLYRSHTMVHNLQTLLHELNWAHRLTIVRDR